MCFRWACGGWHTCRCHIYYSWVVENTARCAMVSYTWKASVQLHAFMWRCNAYFTLHLGHDIFWRKLHAEIVMNKKQQRWPIRSKSQQISTTNPLCSCQQQRIECLNSFHKHVVPTMPKRCIHVWRSGHSQQLRTTHRISVPQAISPNIQSQIEGNTLASVANLHVPLCWRTGVQLPHIIKYICRSTRLQTSPNSPTVNPYCHRMNAA